jgi:hypothetical protein
MPFLDRLIDEMGIGDAWTTPIPTLPSCSAPPIADPRSLWRRGRRTAFLRKGHGHHLARTFTSGRRAGRFAAQAVRQGSE